MDDELRANDFINMREMYKPIPKPQPKIDELVSKAVGKPIYVSNPILIRKIAEWKKEKGDSEEPDNFLSDQAKVDELKRVL
jgi:hypothetical protein